MDRSSVLEPNESQRPTTPSSSRLGRWARRAVAPIERFLAIEAASGICLLVVAAAALAWANSPGQETYHALWHTPVGLRVGSFAFERSLHFVINDGLMTVFFFVVGLEIRREIHRGELSELRRAALPIVAAMGGMIAPALVYVAINAGGTNLSGWGIPMATDIAFAVGVLALLGNRVPPALRVLLLALAVIDDVGAVLVIAIFYSGGLSAGGLVALIVGIVFVTAMQRIGFRNPLAYVVPGIVVWAGAYSAGMHPTLAGVILGLMTPVRAALGPVRFVEQLREGIDRIRTEGIADESRLLEQFRRLGIHRRDAVSPVERLQHVLHGWVAFGVMPLFAFANAGVTVRADAFDASVLPVLVGVFAGLLVGKPLGVLLLSFVAVRLRIASLPVGVGFRHVLFVGGVAGIGFTMALFIAQLAFPPGAAQETAKLGVLAASILAGTVSYVAGRVGLKPTRLGARSVTEAESSTEH